MSNSSSKPPVRIRTRRAASGEPPRRDADGDEYKVGYGRPPPEKRFKAGQSGNPRGRPKRSKNEGTIFRDVLSETFAVTIKGRTRNMTVLEAGFRKQCQKALEGDPKAFAIVERLHQKYFPETTDANGEASATSSPGGSLIADIFLEMAREAVTKDKSGGEE